jgi:hypothetical protein
MRHMAEEQAAGHVRGGPPALHNDPAAIVRDQVAPAVAGVSNRPLFRPIRLL